ncbi:hypothetical protein, partial [uncultured Bacteroides sp.]|uniref:hypothetical protein n=1 Tax=uncultured Bacteroides sp. TaxID=162156 RepID=UPI00261A48D3
GAAYLLQRYGIMAGYGKGIFKIAYYFSDFLVHSSAIARRLRFLWHEWGQSEKSVQNKWACESNNASITPGKMAD